MSKFLRKGDKVKRPTMYGMTKKEKEATGRFLKEAYPFKEKMWKRTNQGIT